MSDTKKNPIKLIPAKSLEHMAKKLNEQLIAGYQPLNVFTFPTPSADGTRIETVFCAVVVSIEAIETAPMEKTVEPVPPIQPEIQPIEIAKPAEVA